MVVPKDITLQDYLDIQNTAYEWADSYDNKDWDRLKRVLGPAIRLDFRALQGPLQENLTPDEFAAIISDKKVIGDPHVKTQHLLGGSSWSSPGDGIVQVAWQLRVAHQRVGDDMMTQINFGHGQGTNIHLYTKIDGVWKLVGVTAKVGWFEGDLFGTLDPTVAKS